MVYISQSNRWYSKVTYTHTHSVTYWMKCSVLSALEQVLHDSHLVSHLHKYTLMPDQTDLFMAVTTVIYHTPNRTLRAVLMVSAAITVI